MPVNAALTLMAEDELQKIVQKNGKTGPKYEKSRGLIPMGSHSVFGNFPSDYLSQAIHTRSREINDLRRSRSAGSLPRINTAPSSGGMDAMQKSNGFSNNPHVPCGSPPKAGATRRRPVEATQFRIFYDRGDLPVSVMQGGTAGTINWKVDIDKLDYHHYMPIFFDGLREKEDPYRFLAVTGAYDLMDRGGAKLLPVVPQLIIPIKKALNTRDPTIICTMLKVLQTLVLSGELIGEALVPYYRQLLPVFNLFLNHNKNIGDSIDYTQRKRLCLGELIHETLAVFEDNGGEDAFINIKYMIPTYESRVKV